MKPRIAVVYAPPAGLGGWGHVVATVLNALSDGEAEVHAIGPEPIGQWPLPEGIPAVTWHRPPIFFPDWRTRYTWLRWFQGRSVFQTHSRMGQWAANRVACLKPDACYVFTEVGLETLSLARRMGIPAILDSASGHIKSFREIYRSESYRWCGVPYIGNPNLATVERVEQEYRLAPQIRVLSEWARQSHASGGVEAAKINAIALPINLQRFHPLAQRPVPDGPLRICYAGTLSLRKGFVYLLRAMRAVGAEDVCLEVVGATGDRWCRALFARERAGLSVRDCPGDPLPAYQRAELFVTPTLEDGFNLTAAEAMACGIPVIVTDACGAAQWVRARKTGWIVRAGSVEALAEALREAMQRRSELSAMGRRARADVERFASSDRLEELREWFYLRTGLEGCRDHAVRG